MGIIENVLSGLGEKIPYEPSFKVVILGDCAGYFENICGIRSYSPEEITLSIKRGGITVRGKELYIKKYCAGDVVICGKISSVERV